MSIKLFIWYLHLIRNQLPRRYNTKCNSPLSIYNSENRGQARRRNGMFMISTTYHKEDFIVWVIYVYSLMRERTCSWWVPITMAIASPTDCVPSVSIVYSTLLINRVMVYRLDNCVCHRQRSIKAHSGVNIIGRGRKLWCPFIIIRVTLRCAKLHFCNCPRRIYDVLLAVCKLFREIIRIKAIKHACQTRAPIKDHQLKTLRVEETLKV